MVKFCDTHLGVEISSTTRRHTPETPQNKRNLSSSHSFQGARHLRYVNSVLVAGWHPPRASKQPSGLFRQSYSCFFTKWHVGCLKHEDTQTCVGFGGIEADISSAICFGSWNETWFFMLQSHTSFAFRIASLSWSTEVVMWPNTRHAPESVKRALKQLAREIILRPGWVVTAASQCERLARNVWIAFQLMLASFGAGMGANSWVHGPDFSVM